MANGPARPGAGRAITGRRASQAVPLQASCLAFGLGTALWAENRAGPARKARSVYQAVPARGLLRQKKKERRTQTEGRCSSRRDGTVRSVAAASLGRWWPTSRPVWCARRRIWRWPALTVEELATGSGGGRRARHSAVLDAAAVCSTPPRARRLGTEEVETREWEREARNGSRRGSRGGGDGCSRGRERDAAVRACTEMAACETGEAAASRKEGEGGVRRGGGRSAARPRRGGRSTAPGSCPVVDSLSHGVGTEGVGMKGTCLVLVIE